MDNPKPSPPTVEVVEEGPSINPMDLVRFVGLAARRNPFTCFTVCLLTLALGLAIVSAIPRKYESTSKIYVSNTGLITSQLTSGHRSIGDEAALKDLFESVYSHDNLVALVRDAELVENWPKTRNWAQRLVDRARAALRGPTSRRDLEEIIISTLERMIDVRTEDSASIRFRASWLDAASAQKLTMLVQENYIAAKKVEELSAITRATTVLEDELKRADEAFEPAVTELKNQIVKLRERNKGKLAQTARPAGLIPIEAIAARPTSSPLELTTKLNEIRDEERAVLEPWQRRTAELKFQLADLRAVYGPAHPSIVALEAKLRAASAEPLELLDIRQREAQLKASIGGFAGAGPVRSGLLSSARPAADPDPLRDVIGNVADDPSLAPARLQLESVLRKSQEMQARLDGVRMELAIAQVGFKYRYRQVEPARLWPKPISPKVPMLNTVAVAVALVFGLLAGAARELIGGKIMEMWQARQLGLNVIATVDVRAWQKHDSNS